MADDGMSLLETMRKTGPKRWRQVGCANPASARGQRARADALQPAKDEPACAAGCGRSAVYPDRQSADLIHYGRSSA
jgi:hypothetical protein